MMRATAKTIAEELGISTATVDRVLNNRSGVKPETIKRVLEKAKELNYKPNKSASLLSRRKQLCVAFVFPTYPEYFWGEIEKGINNALEEIQDFGFTAKIIKTPHDINEQIKVIQDIIKSGSYDGLVFSPSDALPLTNIIDSGIDQGMPIYTFNTDSPSSKRLSYIGTKLSGFRSVSC
jgi:LacI family transcriptional regulator